MSESYFEAPGCWIGHVFRPGPPATTVEAMENAAEGLTRALADVAGLLSRRLAETAEQVERLNVRLLEAGSRP